MDICKENFVVVWFIMFECFKLRKKKVIVLIGLYIIIFLKREYCCNVKFFSCGNVLYFIFVFVVI